MVLALTFALVMLLSILWPEPKEGEGQEGKDPMERRR